MARAAVQYLGLLTGLLLCASGATAAGKRPMTLDDLFRFQRVADPQISPDGKTVAYVVTTVDLSGNKTSSNLWLATVQGSSRRQLTTAAKKDRHPRWSRCDRASGRLRAPKARNLPGG